MSCLADGGFWSVEKWRLIPLMLVVLGIMWHNLTSHHDQTLHLWHYDVAVMSKLFGGVLQLSLRSHENARTEMNQTTEGLHCPPDQTSIFLKLNIIMLQSEQLATGEHKVTSMHKSLAEQQEKWWLQPLDSCSHFETRTAVTLFFSLLTRWWCHLNPKKLMKFCFLDLPLMLDKKIPLTAYVNRQQKLLKK